MSNAPGDTFWTVCFGGSARQRKSTAWMMTALFIWGLTFIGAGIAVQREVVNGPLAWGAATLPVATAIVVMLVFSWFLRDSDELQRRIQLEALALGFGVGWFAICLYPLFVDLGAPVLDQSDYALIMVAFYSLGNFVGWLRYR